MLGKKPTKKESAWLDSITQLGCIVCLIHDHRFTHPEVHHINGGDSHLETIPLCFYHHRQGDCCDSHVSRHPYKAAFEGRYGTEAELLAKTKQMIEDGGVTWP